MHVWVNTEFVFFSRHQPFGRSREQALAKYSFFSSAPGYKSLHPPEKIIHISFPGQIKSERSKELASLTVSSQVLGSIFSGQDWAFAFAFAPAFFAAFFGAGAGVVSP